MIIRQTKTQYRFWELLKAFPSEEYMERKRELAQRLGIGMPQLDRLVRGDCDPSGTQLWKMAEFFGCSVDALYQQEENGRG